MDFQIKKIILWPKKTGLKYKEYEFELGKINIISGASRTGKSAIIPIIDYCLASGSCYIPVKTIRNACSWFGIVIQTGSSQILLARREPGMQKCTDDMYLIEGNDIQIPNEPEKNITADAVKKYLDQLSELSFLEIEVGTTNQYFGRPSFRDLMAFCFQPQNIVANANTLFYRADSAEHRTKLINIFPYILGAVTPDILAKRQEIDGIEKELKQKEREVERLKHISDKWLIDINGWLSAATELGLLDNATNSENATYEMQVEMLSSLTNKTAFDSSVLMQSIEHSSQEIVQLRQEENDISLKLSSFKNRYTEMTQLIKSIDNYKESLSIQIERLNVTKWLKGLSESENTCPICGKDNSQPQEVLEKFYINLKNLEEMADYTGKIPAAFEREYESVKSEIGKLVDQLLAIQNRIATQSHMRSTSDSEKYTIESISRFLGKAQYASETFAAIGSDSQLMTKIDELRIRLKELQKIVNENAIKQKIDSAIKTISNYTMRLIPYLDSERPNDPLKIDYKNLSIVVTGQDGRNDYLWEIGSGSNWLAYHISSILAFQQFFSQQLHSSIPNFIVFDQPSQVYFPQKLATKETDIKELDPKLENDEDQIAVKKIFLTMAKAIQSSKKPFQIIVLEHADKTIWGEINAINEVCEWRGKNKKLIPEEWL